LGRGSCRGGGGVCVAAVDEGREQDVECAAVVLHRVRSFAETGRTASRGPPRPEDRRFHVAFPCRRLSDSRTRLYVVIPVETTVERRLVPDSRKRITCTSRGEGVDGCNTFRHRDMHFSPCKTIDGE